MSGLIYIGLVYVFAYHSSENGKNFKGASLSWKALLNFTALIGQIAFYGLLIWSFFVYTWWQPLVLWVASTIIGGFTAFLFQGNIFGNILSPILCYVFIVLSIVTLIG